MPHRLLRCIPYGAILRVSFIFLGVFALVLAMTQPTPVYAACPSFPHTVAAGDSADLLNAITCANGNGVGSNDTINLTVSTYTLTSALPSITSATSNGSLTINGNGSTILRSSAVGTPNFRIFTVNTNGNLTLNRVTLSNGIASSASGGGIHSLGVLTLVESTVSGNTASFGGGGIYSSGGTLNLIRSTITSNTSGSYGGGLVNSGTMQIVNSTISGNAANGAGGTSGGGAMDLFSGTMLIANSTITNNMAAQTARSGIWQENGVLTIQNSIVAGNNGANNCIVSGGVFTDGGNNLDNGTTCAFGGTVGQNTDPQLGVLATNGGFTRTHAITNTSPAFNRGSNAKAVDQGAAPLTTDQRGTGYARIAAGTVDVGAFEVQCPGFPHTVAASDVVDLRFSLLCANSNGIGSNDVIDLTDSTYTLTAALPDVVAAGTAGTLTINGNGATIQRSSDGGTPNFRILFVSAAGNLALNRVTLSNGLASSASGGGILNNGALTLTESTVRSNTASLGGGGIYSSGGTVTLIRSILSGNTAGSYGGGIVSSGGTLNVIDSTISGNAANGAGGTSGGGAIDSINTTALVANSTITNNTAVQTARSGIWLEVGGMMTIQNSIVSGNNGTNNCADALGLINDNGNNIDNGSSCAFGGSVGTHIDPMLGVLADNGGWTQTHALLPGSPAINAGSNSTAVDHNGAALTLDQRGAGFARINNTTVDIGAFESNLQQLSVQVALQGRTNPAPHASYQITVHVSIMPQGGGEPLVTQDFATNTNGAFSITGLPTGTYLIRFKGTHTLARQYMITILDGVNVKTTDTLLEGDSSDNNGVTIGDFSILAAAFGKSNGQAGYDARADFNGDSAITIADFSLLASNFGKVGEGGVTP